jgi:RimJ/RimL family protein N-acetyltransferase
MTVELQTRRLNFRRYRLADHDAVFELFSDSYARRFYPQMAARDRARDWIAWNLDNYERHGFGLWAIEARDDSRFVGDCGLTYQEVEGRDELEIGYHLRASERGNGFAVEAAAACLGYGFAVLGAERICSIVLPSNHASCAVAGKIHAQRRSFTKGGQPAIFFYTERAEWGLIKKP